MATLHIVMGAPGSGKSTWVQNHLDKKEVRVSRDEVRFSMVRENEEYFSREKEVFTEYIRKIDEALENGLDVFADATHLNRASRLKLMNSINFSFISNIDVIWIKTPLEECIKRNEEREGTRSYVPLSAIKRMHLSIEEPSLEEGFDTIYIVEDNKPIQIIKNIEELNEIVSIN